MLCTSAGKTVSWLSLLVTTVFGLPSCHQAEVMCCEHACLRYQMNCGVSAYDHLPVLFRCTNIKFGCLLQCVRSFCLVLKLLLGQLQQPPTRREMRPRLPLLTLSQEHSTCSAPSSKLLLYLQVNHTMSQTCVSLCCLAALIMCRPQHESKLRRCRHAVLMMWQNVSAKCACGAW